MRVFVSHSSVDKPFVERLCEALSARGISTWRDDAELRVGDSIPEEIGEALNSSDVLCFCWSSHAARSAWVSRELNSFMPRMIARNAPVLPCVLDNTPLPALLADIKWADFKGSFDTGLEQLLRAVRIGEEVKHQEDVRKSTASAAATLDQAEIAFFIDHFRKSARYMIGDTREMRAPYDLLGKLCSLGILDLDTDRYEHLYSLTRVGTGVLTAIQSHYPERRGDPVDLPARRL
jgi:hypothetical protein